MHSNQATSPADALLNFWSKMALYIFMVLNGMKGFETNFIIQSLKLVRNARLPDSRHLTLKTMNKNY